MAQAASAAGSIIRDTDFYTAKARQCIRLARATHDERAAESLRALALEFECMARGLES